MVLSKKLIYTTRQILITLEFSRYVYVKMSLQGVPMYGVVDI